MAVEEIIIAGGQGWRGLNRRGSETNLDPSESPDTTDTANWQRHVGALGPRLGRYRVTTGTYSFLGLGLLACGIGRYKVLANTNGDWAASVVTWAGVTPSTPSSGTLSGMSTTETARFTQFKQRLIGTNGKQRPRSFNGNTWENVGILGGVDMPQFTPTVSYGGGFSIQVTHAFHDGATTATLTTGIPHNLTIGQQITVEVTGSAFDGTFVVASIPTATTLTYAVSGSSFDNSVTGTITTSATSNIRVSTIAITGGVATITTTAPHGIPSGATAVGYFSTPETNGTQGFISSGTANLFSSDPTTVTRTGTTTFTYVTTHANIATTSFNSEDTEVYFNLGPGPEEGITGTYYYAVAPANSKRLDANGRNMEGNPSIVSAVAQPAGGSVIVAGIPSSHVDPQVDCWNIYRTTNGGFDSGIVPEQQDFFYLARVPMGTTTYTDTTDDSTGWYLSATTFNRLRWTQNIPPTTKYAIPFGERVFMWGFDPISGTCSLHGNTTVDTISVSLPDGVKGCFIRFGGEDETYVIKTRGTATTLTLDRAYEGSQTTLTQFTIFRNNYELYFSEYRDADAYGKDGEFFRNKLEIPGQQELVGAATLKDRLLLFTRNDIYAVYGKGPNRFDVKLTPDPVYSGIGAVSGDSVFRVDNEIHFLSDEGPAILSESGVELSGVNLNTDWLDDLTQSELNIACGGSDGRSVWFSVPVSGQTLNSKTYRFERDTKSWWEETEIHPRRFVRQDGTDGQTNILFYLQDRFICRPAYGTLDLVSVALSGSRTGSTSTSLTDSTAAFPTTNGGLEQCYIRIYSSTGSLLATRRIISNTSTAVTWSGDATLPGSGTFTASAGTTYEIGNISWYWTTKTLETPGHLVTTDELCVTFEPIT